MARAQEQPLRVAEVTHQMDLLNDGDLIRKWIANIVLQDTSRLGIGQRRVLRTTTAVHLPARQQAIHEKRIWNGLHGRSIFENPIPSDHGEVASEHW